MARGMILMRNDINLDNRGGDDNMKSLTKVLSILLLSGILALGVNISDAEYREEESRKSTVEVRVPTEPVIVLQVDTSLGATRNIIKNNGQSLDGTYFYAYPGTWADNKDLVSSGDVSNAVKIKWEENIRFDEIISGEYSIAYYNRFNSLGEVSDLPAYFETAYENDGLKDVPYFNVKAAGVTSFKGAFFGGINLRLSNAGEWDTSNIVTLEDSFGYARAIKDEGIGKWDTSKVKSIKNMFRGAAEFNGNISGWNTSNVENMQGAFWSTGKFNQEIGKWDVSKVKNMSSMFNNSLVFNSPLADWDVSSVETMTAMFTITDGLGLKGSFSQDLSKWDVSKVIGIDRDNVSTRFNSKSNMTVEQLPDPWKPIIKRKLTLDPNENFGMSRGNKVGNTAKDWIIQATPNPNAVSITDYKTGGEDWIRIASSATNNLWQGMRADVKEFKPGIDYTFSFTVRTMSGNGKVHAQVQQSGDGNNGPMYNRYVDINTVPKRIHLTFNSATGVNKNLLMPVILGSPNDAKMDILVNDIVFEESRYQDEEILMSAWEDTVDPGYHKAKYDFIGWYDNPNGTGNKYLLGEMQMPNNDLKLFARWSIKTANIDYVWNGRVISTESFQAKSQDFLSSNMLLIPPGYQLKTDVSKVRIDYNARMRIPLDKMMRLKLDPNDLRSPHYLNQIPDSKFKDGLGGFSPIAGLPSYGLSRAIDDGTTWLRVTDDGKGTSLYPAAVYSTQPGSMKHGQRYTFAFTAKNISKRDIRVSSIIHSRGGSGNDPQHNSPYVTLKPGETRRIYNTFVSTTNKAKTHYALQLVSPPSSEGGSDILYTDVTFNESYMYDSNALNVVGKAVSLPTLSREGYKFLGFYDNPAGTGNMYTSSTPMPDKDITLYAKWEAITVKHTFDLGAIQSGVGSSNAYGFGCRGGIYLKPGIRYYFETTGGVNQEAFNNGYKLVTYVYASGWTESTYNSIEKVVTGFADRGFGMSQFTPAVGGEYHVNNYLYHKTLTPSEGNRKGLATVFSTLLLQNSTGEGNIWKTHPVGYEITLPIVGREYAGKTGYWRDPVTNILHKPGEKVKITSERRFNAEWK